MRKIDYYKRLFIENSYDEDSESFDIYDLYIRNQLRRTAPEEQGIMTQTEFAGACT
jgi:hypothetical protein